MIHCQYGMLLFHSVRFGYNWPHLFHSHSEQTKIVNRVCRKSALIDNKHLFTQIHDNTKQIARMQYANVRQEFHCFRRTVWLYFVRCFVNYESLITFSQNGQIRL